MNDVKVAKKLLRTARELLADWPSNVDEGGLREAMGLDPNQPLEDQASPSDVIDFFNNTDESGRGMVMFAVNSNQDSDFWQSVKEGIGEE